MEELNEELTFSKCSLGEPMWSVQGMKSETESLFLTPSGVLGGKGRVNEVCRGKCLVCLWRCSVGHGGVRVWGKAVKCCLFFGGTMIWRREKKTLS